MSPSSSASCWMACFSSGQPASRRRRRTAGTRAIGTAPPAPGRAPAHPCVRRGASSRANRPSVTHGEAVRERLEVLDGLGAARPASRPPSPSTGGVQDLKCRSPPAGRIRRSAHPPARVPPTRAACTLVSGRVPLEPNGARHEREASEIIGDAAPSDPSESSRDAA